MTQIQECARSIQRWQAEISALKIEVAIRRESLKRAQERLYRLIDEEMAGAQELPFGEAESNGQPAVADAVTDDHEEDEAEADALAAIESGKAEGRKRSKGK